MTLLLSGLAMVLAVCCAGEPWIPGDCKLPERPALLPREQVVVKTPSGTVFRPSDLSRTVSLNGQWTFSGLESSGTPFPATAGADAVFAAPDFDDSGWGTIRVPLNWFQNPATSYEKMLKYTTSTDIKGGATVSRLDNPAFKGWYRHSIELPAPLPPGRIRLRFEGISYEAELFVNGQKAGRHHGSFVAWTPDITPYVKPGKNLIAVRVLYDFGPKDGVYTHVYGTTWGHTFMNAGIWLPVRLMFDTEPLITDIRLTTRDVENGTLRVDYTVINHGDKPLSLTPGVAVTFAGAKASPAPGSEFPEITLETGVRSGTLELRVDKPELWSPAAPRFTGPE